MGEGMHAQFFIVVRQENWDRKNNQSTESTVDGSMFVNKITEQNSGGIGKLTIIIWIKFIITKIFLSV